MWAARESCAVVCRVYASLRSERSCGGVEGGAARTTPTRGSATSSEDKRCTGEVIFIVSRDVCEGR